MVKNSHRVNNCLFIFKNKHSLSKPMNKCPAAAALIWAPEDKWFRTVIYGVAFYTVTGLVFNTNEYFARTILMYGPVRQNCVVCFSVLVRKMFENKLLRKLRKSMHQSKENI